MGCAGSRVARGEGGAGGSGGAPLAPPPLASDTRHLRVKLVLLGDSGVGKSCVVMRFVRGSFDADSRVTVGAACARPSRASCVCVCIPRVCRALSLHAARRGARARRRGARRVRRRLCAAPLAVPLASLFRSVVR
jgi:hypothetical protein